MSDDNTDEPVSKKQKYDESNDICNELEVEIPITDDEINNYNTEVTKLTNENIPSAIFRETPEINRPNINNSNVHKSIILAITSHGLIPCVLEKLPYNYTGEHIYTPEIIEVPENIEIHKFTISSPGTIAWSSDYMVKYYLSIIYTFSNTLLNNKHMPDYIIEAILDSFKRAIPRLNLINNYNSQNEDHYSYKHYSHKGYKYYSLKHGDKIINKWFLRDETEKNGNDFSILEINKPMNASTASYDVLPDLFDKMYTSKPDKFYTLSMNNIIDYYRNIGITRIIMFDFTCSVFSKSSASEIESNTLIYLTPEQTRNIRRNICKTNIPYGGYRMHNKNKKRTRRTRKPRKSKKSRRKSIRRRIKRK